MSIATMEKTRLQELLDENDEVSRDDMTEFLMQYDGKYWLRTWDAANGSNGVLMMVFKDGSCLSLMAYRNVGEFFFRFHSPVVLKNDF